MTTTIHSTTATLDALAQGTRAVPVRNTQSGITVFTDEFTKHSTTWGAAGDVSGDDIREVPPTYLDIPDFRSAVMRGLLTIEVDQDVLAAAASAQMADWDARQLSRQESVHLAKRNSDRRIGRGIACIAPGKSRGELCGLPALIMGSQIDDKPPLCSEHVVTAGQYVSVDTGRFVDGKAETLWKRAGTRTS